MLDFISSPSPTPKGRQFLVRILTEFLPSYLLDESEKKKQQLVTWIFFFLILCILRFGNIKIIAWPWSFFSWCRFCISLRPSPSYLEVKNYCMRCSFITQIFVENLLLGRKQSKVMGQRMVGVGIGPGSILYRMVWDNLLEEMIFDLSSEWCKSGERITGRWCSKHKGSEAEISLMSSWNRRAVWLGYSGQGGEWNDMKFEKEAVDRSHRDVFQVQ